MGPGDAWVGPPYIKSSRPSRDVASRAERGYRCFMPDDPKPKTPLDDALDDARDAFRRAKEQLAPGLKAASVVLKPAARAAKRAAWDPRRAVQPEKIHDEVNKALGLEARHEIDVDGVIYRIAKVADEKFEARSVRDDAVYGSFMCDLSGRIRRVDCEDGDIRHMVDIAERAVSAGLAR